MQMAMAVGECSGEDADLLRRAMGSKRGIEQIESLRERLYAGMAQNGLVGEAADAIYRQIQSFASFGFAESHSLSFALLVYASAWVKLHYPGAFLAGLLRAQPMGFYSPATLTADARRHGVVVLRPDLAASGVEAGLEPLDEGAGAESVPEQEHRRDGGFAVRLGLAGIRGIGRPSAERIVAERDSDGPYRSLADLARRCGLDTVQLESLATADALRPLGLDRRQGLWMAGAAAEDQERYLAGSALTVQPPLFPDPTAFEVLRDELWATGISVDDHPLAHFRPALADRGVLPSAALRTAEAGRRIEIAGVVTHRQRPATASGITFLNLEDEHGLINVVCSMGVWTRYRRIARESSALIIRGILERSPEGVVNLIADRFEPLRLGIAHHSRDFR